MENEEWKPIWHAHNYEVSNLGRVRSLDTVVEYLLLGVATKRSKKGKVLTPYKSRTTKNKNKYYLGISLSRKYKTESGNTRKFWVHRLVAEAFLPNPHSYPEVNHKDNNGLNNNLENLEWVTGSMNLKHAVEIGAFPSGAEVHNAKFTSEDVKRIREQIAIRGDDKITLRSIARENNVGYETIYKLHRRETYKLIT